MLSLLGGCSTPSISRSTAGLSDEDIYVSLASPLLCTRLFKDDIQNSRKYNTPYICYYSINKSSLKKGYKITLSEHINVTLRQVIPDNDAYQISVYSDRKLTNENIGLVLIAE